MVDDHFHRFVLVFVLMRPDTRKKTCRQAEAEDFSAMAAVRLVNAGTTTWPTTWWR